MNAWILARGTGFAAVALLTASMLLGLAMSFRVRSRRWPRGVVNEAHRVATAWALAMVAAHVACLLADPASGVGPWRALVPFVGAGASPGVGLGVLAMYAVAVVHATTRMRARLGTARWRALHRLAYAGFALAMVHGVLAGTDTGRWWATGLYVAGALAVGLLIALRVWPREGETAAPEPAAAARRGLPPLLNGTNSH